MDEINSLIGGFQVALSWYNLALMFVGILLGVIIGVLPGLGGANGVAILLPLTFAMPPTSAIIMLSCIYWGALFGGAITSILFNIPGEPWSVATTFDGHPMAQQGRADEALTAAFTSSFVGALVAVVVITFLAPIIARFALQFGPAEFFSVFFLTFASFVGMGRGSPFKVLAAMCLGFTLGAVGLDNVTGTLRMTFGHDELLVGFDFLIAVIGLVSLLIALSLAFLPWLAPWRHRLADALRSQGTSSTDGPLMRRLRGSLIAFEVAGSVVLLVGCGLMIRSAVNLMNTDLGFNPHQVLRVGVRLPARTYT